MKVYFNKTVRYQGQEYVANTIFNADKKDLAELKKAGCFIVDDGSEVEVEEDNTINEESKLINDDYEDLTELTVPELQLMAERMGIDFKSSWRKDKLIEEIQKVENELAE